MLLILSHHSFLRSVFWLGSILTTYSLVECSLQGLTIHCTLLKFDMKITIKHFDWTTSTLMLFVPLKLFYPQLYNFFFLLLNQPHSSRFLKKRWGGFCEKRTTRTSKSSAERATTSIALRVKQRAQANEAFHNYTVSISGR